MEAGSGGPVLTGSQLPAGLSGPALVVKLLDEAVANGFTVIRAWAHGVSPRYPSMLAPGR